MADCYEGCKDCSNPVCPEKAVLVLSSFGQNNNNVDKHTLINFQGHVQLLHQIIVTRVENFRKS